MEKEINAYVGEAIQSSARLGDCTRDLIQAAEMLGNCIRTGGKILACGNGGSTCDAMHLVEELVARYKRERPGIRAQHLCDAATLTCWSNDYHFEDVFARQVETLADVQDTLVVFSTSGNSKNIIKALEAASKIGCRRIGLLGKGGGAAAPLCDATVIVPSNITAHIQEAHVVFIHAVCEALEVSIFPESDA